MYSLVSAALHMYAANEHKHAAVIKGTLLRSARVCLHGSSADPAMISGVLSILSSSTQVNIAATSGCTQRCVVHASVDLI